MKYWFYIVLFENMYFCCTYLIKTEISSILGTAYFLKIARINCQQGKPICQISFRKTQKIANPQK